MRSLRKNMSGLQYALYSENVPVYELDSQGNPIYDEIDGEQVYRIIDYKNGYSTPVSFDGNIAFSGGQSEADVFGISTDAYDSKLAMSNDILPITETSLIFKDSTPAYDTNGYLKESSADFRVVKIAKSLNETVYLLKRIVHDA